MLAHGGTLENRNYSHSPLNLSTQHAFQQVTNFWFDLDGTTLTHFLPATVSVSKGISETHSSRTRPAWLSSSQTGAVGRESVWFCRKEGDDKIDSCGRPGSAWSRKPRTIPNRRHLFFTDGHLPAWSSVNSEIDFNQAIDFWPITFHRRRPQDNSLSSIWFPLQI